MGDRYIKILISNQYHGLFHNVNRLILDMEARIGLRDKPAALRGLIRGHWVNAPVFPDARIFFERCPVSIYIITNNGLPYMEQALNLIFN